MARLRYNGLCTGAVGSLAPLSLGAPLTSTGTTVTFNAALTHNGGAAVPTIAGSDYIPLFIKDATGNTTEIVYLTAYTSGATSGTITRGKEGTTGVAHSSGDKVAHGPTVNDSNRAVGAQAYNNAGTSIPNGLETKVPLASESFDTDGFHDNVTNNTRLTVPTGLDGYYIITAALSYVFNATGSRTAAVFINGTRVGATGVSGSISSAPSHTYIANLAAGDYVELGTYQDSGGARALATDSATRLTMLRFGL